MQGSLLLFSKKRTLSGHRALSLYKVSCLSVLWLAIYTSRNRKRRRGIFEKGYVREREVAARRGVLKEQVSENVISFAEWESKIVRRS